MTALLLITAIRQKLMEENTKITDRIFERYPNIFDIRDWNGKLIKGSDDPKFTITFKDKKAFKDLFMRADLYAAANAYNDDRLSIDGDSLEALRLADHFVGLRLSLRGTITRELSANVQ